MKKPAVKRRMKWERVYDKLGEALRLSDEANNVVNRASVSNAVKEAEDLARLFTSRAGTREETSAGLAIVDALEEARKWDDRALLHGAVLAARRLVAREVALSTVRNTQRRYITERGRAKSEEAKQRRNRAVSYALSNVWASLKLRRKT